MARRTTLNEMRSIEDVVRAILREAGAKLGMPSRAAFADRVKELAGGDPMVTPLVAPLLAILTTMLCELAHLTKQVLNIVRPAVRRRPRREARDPRERDDKQPGVPNRQLDCNQPNQRRLSGENLFGVLLIMALSQEWSLRRSRCGSPDRGRYDIRRFPVTTSPSERQASTKTQVARLEPLGAIKQNASFYVKLDRFS